MKGRHLRRSVIASRPETAILLVAFAATSGCLTPGQTREVHSQLQEIRRQVDQLQMQQESSRQAVDETLGRGESKAAPVGDAVGVNDAAFEDAPVAETGNTAGPPAPDARKAAPPAMTAGEPSDVAELHEADRLYREGYALYHRGDHAGAERALRSFLRQVPGSPRADNAQYWIGETYYSRGLYREAISEFTRVVTDYPQGEKAAHAMYKIALCHEHLNEGPLARVNLEALVRAYPDSDIAPLARERLQGR